MGEVGKDTNVVDSVRERCRMMDSHTIIVSVAGSFYWDER